MKEEYRELKVGEVFSVGDEYWRLEGSWEAAQQNNHYIGQKIEQGWAKCRRKVPPKIKLKRKAIDPDSRWRCMDCGQEASWSSWESFLNEGAEHKCDACFGHKNNGGRLIRVQG